MNITNYFVDHDGRTYRAALADTSPQGRPLVVVRRDHTNHDAGPALDIEGRIGRACVAKARAQMEAKSGT